MGADSCVVPVLLPGLQIPPVGDTAFGGTEAGLSALPLVFIQILSALPAAGVLILPRSDFVPCAVHPDGVFAEPGYLGNAGEAVPVFPQSFYPLFFISCHNDVLLKTYEGMALHLSKEFGRVKFRGRM